MNAYQMYHIDRVTIGDHKSERIDRDVAGCPQLERLMQIAVGHGPLVINLLRIPFTVEAARLLGEIKFGPHVDYEEGTHTRFCVAQVEYATPTYANLKGRSAEHAKLTKLVDLAIQARKKIVIDSLRVPATKETVHLLGELKWLPREQPEEELGEEGAPKKLVAAPGLTLVQTENLCMRIEELELSVRSYNCLQNQYLTFVHQLASMTEAELSKTKTIHT